MHGNTDYSNNKYKCKKENQVKISKKFSWNQPFDERGSQKRCSTAPRCRLSWPRERRRSTWSCRTMWAFHEDCKWLISFHFIMIFIDLFCLLVQADVILMKAELYFVTGVRPGNQKLTFLVIWSLKLRYEDEKTTDDISGVRVEQQQGSALKPWHPGRLQCQPVWRSPGALPKFCWIFHLLGGDLYHALANVTNMTSV